MQDLISTLDIPQIAYLPHILREILRDELLK